MDDTADPLCYEFGSMIRLFVGLLTFLNALFRSRYSLGLAIFASVMTLTSRRTA